MNKPTCAFLSLVLSLIGFATAAEVAVLPFDDVRAGMRGTGRTTFQGTEVTTFDVEIVGVLPNVGPDQSLILGRCSGGPLADTGVLAGMSGSPVTIDGKLVGAVAYSWGFAKEAIAGITPIEEMLGIADLAEEPGLDRADFVAPGRDDLQRLRSAGGLRAFLADELWQRFRRPVGSLRVAIPLTVSGLGAAGLSRIEPQLAGAGFLPLQAGGSTGNSGPVPELVPGSPVGVKLVRGDLEITATGTVTWVDGDRVLAFGHPLFGLGEVDLPLTGATVQTLLPSLMQSSRIASPLAEVGALRQDRASGVFGRLAARPRMIPIRFKLTHPSRPERDYSFDIADDPLLSPLLLYVSLNGILASRERTFGSATVRVREGSVIKMARGVDVELDNVFSGRAAFDYGTGIPAYILYLLMNNAWSRPEIAGINLILEYADEPQTAQIRRAALDRYHVRGGEEVEATIVVAPYRGPDRVFTRTVRIPEESPPGTLTLHVGGALAVSRAEEQYEPVLPRDLDQLIRLINQLRRNDRIYVAATREDSGILIDGVRLPNLPPSVSNVLTRPKRRGNFTRVPRRAVLEEVIRTEYAVEGVARIELEVEAR
jgi:hypothetical protein